MTLSKKKPGLWLVLAILKLILAILRLLDDLQKY